MTDSDRPSFAQTLGALFEAFGKKATAAAIEAYWLACRDMDIESFRDAAIRCLKTSKFMPVPADLREKGGADDDGSVAALLAWEAFCGGERDGGRDPVARKVLDSLGGWDRIGLMESETVHTHIRREFLRVYPLFHRKRDELGLGGGDRLGIGDGNGTD